MFTCVHFESLLVYSINSYLYNLRSRTCITVGHPMFFTLHWDGTGAKGLQAAPICIGVANTNSCSATAQFCLGYMPHTPDEDKVAKPTELKHYLRQQCCKAILRVLNTVAEYGVLCRLPNREGVQTIRVLYPRLMAMNFDQPEAQLFFGLRNKTSCAKCKWRKGRSAFRKASSQKGSAVRLLYDIHQNTSNSKEVRTKAGRKLLRWGFNPDRSCCLYTGMCPHGTPTCTYLPCLLVLFTITYLSAYLRFYHTHTCICAQVSTNC